MFLPLPGISSTAITKVTSHKSADSPLKIPSPSPELPPAPASASATAAAAVFRSDLAGLASEDTPEAKETMALLIATEQPRTETGMAFEPNAAATDALQSLANIPGKGPRLLAKEAQPQLEEVVKATSALRLRPLT